MQLIPPIASCVISNPVAVIVALSVPELQWISSVPLLFKPMVGSVHEPNVSSVTATLTVSDELPVFSSSPLIVDSGQWASTEPPVVSVIIVVPGSILASNLVPAEKSHPAAAQPDVSCVLQRTVAEALLAPRNAIKAVAATAARPKAFRHFMISFPCSGGRAPGCVMTASRKTANHLDC
jgi:hypothetical protein